MRKLLFLLLFILLTGCKNGRYNYESEMFKEENITLLSYNAVKNDIRLRFVDAVSYTNIENLWLGEFFSKDDSYNMDSDLFLKLEVYLDANDNVDGGGYNIMNAKLKIVCQEMKNVSFFRFFYVINENRREATSYVSTYFLEKAGCLEYPNNIKDLNASLDRKYETGRFIGKETHHFYSNIITIPSHEINNAFVLFEEHY